MSPPSLSAHESVTGEGEPELGITSASPTCRPYGPSLLPGRSLSLPLHPRVVKLVRVVLLYLCVLSEAR